MPSKKKLSPTQVQQIEANMNNLASYNSGSALGEVERAFSANYYPPNKLGQYIRHAMALVDNGKWTRDNIGHSSGGNNSGKHPDTDRKAQQCKNSLIKWAQNHQYS